MDVAEALNVVEEVGKVLRNPDHWKEQLKTFQAAAKIGNVEVLKSLLKDGVDVNSEFGQSQLTALHICCAEGHLEAVKLLLKQPNIKLDPTDKFGNSPYAMITPGENRVRIQELLDTAIGNTIEDEDIVGKYGAIGKSMNQYHTFISHVYNENRTFAQSLKQSLKDLGVNACLNQELFIQPDKLESMIMDSDSAIIIISRKYMNNVLRDDELFPKGNALELQKILEFIDEYKITLVIADEKATNTDSWKGEFMRLAEGTVINMSSDKLKAANLGKLYAEIKRDCS